MSITFLPHRLDTLATTTLWGLRTTHNLLNMQNAEQWMALRGRLQGSAWAAPAHWYAVNFYPQDYFSRFAPENPYDLACCVAADPMATKPDFLAEVVIPAGLYAVFTYQGLPSAAPFEWILGSWLPASAYRLAHRPHFEKLPADYRPNNPEATEEIWLPIDIQ